MKCIWALAMSIAVVGCLKSDPLVTVQNFQPWPGAPGVLSTPGDPFVLVMVFDDSAHVDHYDVTLPWRDKSGIRHESSQRCEASKDSPNTACVFDVDASSVEGAIVVSHGFIRPIPNSKKR